MHEVTERLRLAFVTHRCIDNVHLGRSALLMLVAYACIVYLARAWPTNN